MINECLPLILVVGVVRPCLRACLCGFLLLDILLKGVGILVNRLSLRVLPIRFLLPLLIIILILPLSPIESAVPLIHILQARVLFDGLLH